MNSTLKKILSCLIVILVIFGAFVSAKGIGSVDDLKDSLKYGLDIDGGVYVEMQADTHGLSQAKAKEAMEQTKEVLEKRVNAMGVSEATVAIEGDDRFRIEMPGVKDARTAIKRIGETAQLRFTTADNKEYLTGSDIKSASADVDDQNGGYKIVLNLTNAGREKFKEATAAALSGNITATVQENGVNVSDQAVVIWLDDDVLTAPVPQEVIDNDSCEITSGQGGYSKEEASTTAALIRGGSLPLQLKEVSSSVQTASIGADALDKSIKAGMIGLCLVFLLMLLAYNLLGLIADIALALYVMLVLWIMSAMGAVLTLPGIAGIVLGIGMAVDANVIIFTRIKEEIGNGKSVRVAVHEGFRHALVTVLDSQITTLIATVVLYELGSATVKGFAITLMISIIISIFTAVVVSQVMVSCLADVQNPRLRWFGCNADGTPRKWIKHDFAIIENRKKFYALSGTLIAIGLVCLFARGFNYGIDFTGGTMIQMNLGKKVAEKDIAQTLDKFNLNEDIVYSGDKQESVIIRTSKPLDADGRYEVQQAMEKAYNLDDSAVESSEEFGATIGAGIKKNAIKSILIAALGMLLYIIFRFRSWKYGVAAVAGLGHDVLILIGVYAVFGITVNNPFIAAILTIVGYSINDTIVIFDRVRENMHLMRGKPVMEVLDHSISQTLDRSIMTSLTTIIAIVPLLVMVSAQLAQFVLPLMVGVICGTYSSIALCSPLFFEFNKRQERSKYQAQQAAKKRIEAKRAQRAAIEKEERAEEKAEKAAEEKAKQAAQKKSNPSKKNRKKNKKKR